MKLITELPHATYSSGNINGIDFRIEKMPLSNDEKKTFARAFISGKGIIGKLNKSKKYYLFTPDHIKQLLHIPKGVVNILPPYWQKYAVILTDDARKLEEVIRVIIRELMVQKLNTRTRDLIEASIGKISQKINIVINLDKTKHAAERQHRHKTEITDNDIRDLAQKAIETIGNMLIMNELDVNDRIGIYDKSTDLNLVGALERTGDNLEFVIVTVMIEKNFHFSKVRKIIRI